MNIKKIMAAVLVCLLTLLLSAPAAFAEEAQAALMRLEQTEGQVTVKNKDGRTLTANPGSRLYEGSTIETGPASYAYISLDKDKAVKLDAESLVTIQSAGKKLELEVNKGGMMFNVKAPLKADETMNIRTSTMVTGIRGTSGFVETRSSHSSSVSILEGTVSVEIRNPENGQAQTISVTGGQTAQAQAGAEAGPGAFNRVTVSTLKEEQISGYVAVEIAKDNGLQEKIQTNSVLNVQQIAASAQEKLDQDQQKAQEASKTEVPVSGSTEDNGGSGSTGDAGGSGDSGDTGGSDDSGDSGGSDDSGDGGSGDSGSGQEPSDPDDKPQEDRVKHFTLEDFEKTGEGVYSDTEKKVSRALNSWKYREVVIDMEEAGDARLLLEGYILSGRKLTVNGSGSSVVIFQQTFHNLGTMNFYDTKAAVSGKGRNLGEISLENSQLIVGNDVTNLQEVEDEDGSDMRNFGTITVGDGSSISHKGRFINRRITKAGEILVQKGGTILAAKGFENEGVVEMEGTLELTTPLVNNRQSGEMMICGAVTGEGYMSNGGMVNVRNGSFDLSRLKNTGGTIVIEDGTEAELSDRFENQGTLVINGSLVFEVTLVNLSGYTIENNGDIENDGTIENRGTFINNGIYAGDGEFKNIDNGTITGDRADDIPFDEVISSPSNAKRRQEKEERPAEVIRPEVPETPEMPEVPGTPEVPGEPEMPEEPEIPGVPGEPEAPENPEEPEKPETPEVPGEPEVPENPEGPETPEEPGEPEVPENPEEPEIPEIPEEPEIPGVPGKPEVPENPEIPETPEEPEAPESPETPEEPEYPEVPGEPETPENPEPSGEPEAPKESEEPEESETPTPSP